MPPFLTWEGHRLRSLTASKPSPLDFAVSGSGKGFDLSQPSPRVAPRARFRVDPLLERVEPHAAITLVSTRKGG